MGRNRGGATKRPREPRVQEYITPAQQATVHNTKFTKFYQGAIIPEEEWEPFMASLRSCLPSCFRVNTSLPNAAAVRDLIEAEVPDLQEISFVPQRMAFQTPAGRGAIKRDVAMKRVKRLVHVLNEEGFLSRQEAVSMIPPILLDVRAGHRVIDMCAAPGSKTTQILERLVAQGPGGVVVANDVNQGRLDVLNHQTARLPDAKSRLIITNHDATAYPLVISSDLKYDRVLCDVMCSGDGTLRKSMDLWARWGPLLGPHLHVQQSKVLLRGMGLCKVGGIVVYSTCSLNPVEDEAVIAKCLQEAGGAFELIDASAQLSGLKFYKGMHTWRLLSPDGSTELFQPGDDGKLTVDACRPGNAGAAATESPTVQENGSPQPENGDEAAVVAADEDGERPAPAEVGETTTAVPGAAAGKTRGKGRFTFTKAMFPPPPEVAAALHLERCIRVAPHLNDTGGFFIAALRCVTDMPKSVSSAVRGKYDTLPFKPITPEALAQVRSAIALPDSFPVDRLFCATEATRLPKVYLLSKDCAAMGLAINAKVVQMGVKVFESAVKKSWAHCRFATDGAATIAPLLGDTLLARADAARVLDAIEKTDGAEVAGQLTFGGETAFRSCVSSAPATLPKNGVLEVACGSAIGRTFLPFEVRGVCIIRFTQTQVGLLRIAAGRPLVSEAAADDDDESSGSDEEPGEKSREQPAAE
jgi:tRNA (cytosine34-C5)-methyltransferase